MFECRECVCNAGFQYPFCPGRSWDPPCYNHVEPTIVNYWLLQEIKIYQVDREAAGMQQKRLDFENQLPPGNKFINIYCLIFQMWGRGKAFVVILPLCLISSISFCKTQLIPCSPKNVPPTTIRIHVSITKLSVFLSPQLKVPWKELPKSFPTLPSHCKQMWHSQNPSASPPHRHLHQLVQLSGHHQRENKTMQDYVSIIIGHLVVISLNLAVLLVYSCSDFLAKRV